MITDISNRRYVPALDGVRGIAIMLVVLYHNFGFGDQFYIGWLGVDLFFVLSGYLITGILIDTVNSKKYLRNFYARRVLRIFPLYYLVLIIFLILFPAINFHKQSLGYYTDNQLWFWGYLENWLLIFNFPQGTEYLNHFWSLAVEEQFYLIWPFIVLLLKKPKTLLVFMLFVLVLLVVVRSCLWSLKIENFNYTLFYRFTRIDGICIGCIIALSQKINLNFLSKNTAYIVTGLAGINFLFYFLNRAGEFDFPYLAFVGYTTFAAMFGLLVNEAAMGNNRLVNTLFSLPPLRYIGRISYGFYIFHFPIYLLLSPILYNFISSYFVFTEKTAQLTVSITATIIAFIVSVISYHTFEMIFLKMKNRFT